jgi:CheY-like chemotaxis protein
MFSLNISAGRRDGFATPTLGRDPNPSALTRMRQTARSITGRVRHALLPAGTEFEPLRVLVVDDHPDAAEALAAVVELLNCPIRACHDGWSALEAAAEFRPQVCLLDLMMPKMDGLELAVRLREQAGCRPLLLVAVTALGDIEARTQTALAGFHDHLTKPVDATVLIETLTRLGEVLRRAGESSADEP